MEEKKEKEDKMTLKKKWKKVVDVSKKTYGVAKKGYNIGKTTVKVVKRDLGIKKSKKKKRWATPQEFNRSFAGY